jgi:isoprenylcysteine carboxyl methyltransferase (ICMT) family protein YpbQ
MMSCIFGECENLHREHETISFQKLRLFLEELCATQAIMVRILDQMNQVWATNIDLTDHVLLVYQSFRVVRDPNNSEAITLEYYGVSSTRTLPRGAQPYATTSLRISYKRIVGIFNDAVAIA